MVAIIGGEPERFRPLIDLYREAGRRAGHPAERPVSYTHLSCAVASGVVYCVGGGGEGVLPNLNSTYYAPLSGSGIGNWTASTAYPVSVYHASCVTSSGYLYCVNGVGPDGLTDGTAYFARITSEGIGEWAATDDFP